VQETLYRDCPPARQMPRVQAAAVQARWWALHRRS